MRSLWQRGLQKWPYLAAVLAFLVSMGIALQYGAQYAWASGAKPDQVIVLPTALSGAALPASTDKAAPPSRLQSVLVAVAATTKSYNAVIWPLLILILLLVLLRLGAAIAGIGYDCGRSLILITALVGSALLTASRASGMA